MAEKWYVVRTFSGHENKVKQLLEAELEDREELRAKILEILVPTEKVFEVKDGKKKSKTKNFFPGYILVQAEMDNQVKEFISNTQSVMGFLGTQNNPNPLQAEEVKIIVGTKIREVMLIFTLSRWATPAPSCVRTSMSPALQIRR